MIVICMVMSPYTQLAHSTRVASLDTVLLEQLCLAQCDLMLPYEFGRTSAMQRLFSRPRMPSFLLPQLHVDVEMFDARHRVFFRRAPSGKVESIYIYICIYVEQHGSTRLGTPSMRDGHANPLFVPPVLSDDVCGVLPEAYTPTPTHARLPHAAIDSSSPTHPAV